MELDSEGYGWYGLAYSTFDSVLNMACTTMKFSLSAITDTVFQS